MMNQIQIWRLLVDIGLITSVLTMTVRAFKASRLPSMLPKTRELEASLRSLIGDAETAGIQLNDQLLRREQNIQRALSEIQQSEARIAAAISEAEALQNKLQQSRVETVRVIQDLKHGFEREMQSQRSRLEEQASAPHIAIPPQAPMASQASMTSNTHFSTPSQPVEQSSAFIEQMYSRTPLQRTVEATSAASPPPQGLQRAAAATQTSPRSMQAQPTAAELQRVYKSAEMMIRDGQTLESVASQMKLPLEGVRLLAQMIEIEHEEDSRKQGAADAYAAKDSRLGALAAIRRQTSVL
ncbi:MAG: hypothetical protein RL518_1796 [Pseudomonadota bacterium]|jgi:hypothetical protein